MTQELLLLLVSLYGHYTGQPVLAGTPSYEPQDFAAAKFYWLQLAHLGYGEHIRVPLDGVTCTVTVP